MTEIEHVTLTVEDEETVDGVPVLATDDRADLVPATGTHPAVQAAAVAAGSLVAGVAAVAVLRHQHRRGALRPRLPRRRGRRVNVIGSRSFLVDVHLIQR